MISFIIPTYNESALIEETLSNLIYAISDDDEIIVVDGKSEDKTLEIVNRFSEVRIIKCKQKGRAAQMNMGAEKAQKEFILFLHADSSINSIGINKLKQTIKNHNVSWGWFDLKLHSPRKIYRVLETLAQFRTRVISEPLGDHGIFIKKEVFNNVGGFPKIPIMEDVELVKKLKTVSKGTRINHGVESSVRRFENCGIIKTSLNMIFLRFFHFFGVSPQTLAKYYRPER